MFYIPAYSPDLNPDEYLNSDLKNSVASKPQPRNEDEIQTSAEEFMTFLSEKPDHVASYFEHEKVAYQKIKDDAPENHENFSLLVEQ